MPQFVSPLCSEFPQTRGECLQCESSQSSQSWQLLIMLSSLAIHTFHASSWRYDESYASVAIYYLLTKSENCTNLNLEYILLDNMLALLFTLTVHYILYMQLLYSKVLPLPLFHAFSLACYQLEVFYCEVAAGMWYWRKCWVKKEAATFFHDIKLLDWMSVGKNTSTLWHACWMLRILVVSFICQIKCRNRYHGFVEWQ